LMRERFSCPLPSVDYQLLFNGLGSGSAGLGSRSHGFFVNHCSHPLSCTLNVPDVATPTLSVLDIACMNKIVYNQDVLIFMYI